MEQVVAIISTRFTHERDQNFKAFLAIRRYEKEDFISFRGNENQRKLKMVAR